MRPSSDRALRLARSRHVVLLTCGLVVALACLLAVSTTSARLPSLGPACGGFAQQDCATPEYAAECRDGGSSLLGTTDRNPGNAIPEPVVGRRLIPRRSDGRVPFGFNDASFYLRASNPGIGLNGTEDAYAHRLAGSSVIRLTLHWGWMQRNREWIDWVEADRAYCNSIRAGLAPIFAIFGTPKWAIVGGQRCDGYCFAPPDQSHDGDLRDFAEQVAIRYPHLAAVEAWNEPNLDYFWHSPVPGGAGPDPARYTAVLKTVFEGVKSGNPATPVLGASLSDAETSDRAPGIPLGDFLSGMYDNGARRWMDGLSFHPYPEFPKDWNRADWFHKTLATVRSLVASRDYPGRRLWLTELGARLQHTVRPYTEGSQSADLLSYYRDLQNEDDVDVAVFHTLIDQNDYGWLKPRDATGKIFPRPVYCAFADRFGPLASGESVMAPTFKQPSDVKAKHRRTVRRHRHRSHLRHLTGPRRIRHKRKVHRHVSRRAVTRPMDCSKALAFPAS
jgi:hypothetical protein